MTAEHAKAETNRSQMSLENILHLKEELLSLWEQMPGEHKATIALVLFDEFQQSERGTWLKGATELKSGKEPLQTTRTFPVISLSRAGLSQIFSEEEVAQFSDHDTELIAQGIGTGLNLNPGFWNAVEESGRLILESQRSIFDKTSATYDTQPNPNKQDDEAEFSQWMQEVDNCVWMISGCSIHDLPDCDFRSMFNDGASPAEMANEAFQETGIDLFD